MASGDSCVDRQVTEVVADAAPDPESYRIDSAAVGEGGDLRVTFVAPPPELAQQALELQAAPAEPREEKVRRSADLLALRNQIAAAEGNSAVQASLDAILQEKELELDAIEEQLLAWTNLQDLVQVVAATIVTAGVIALLAMAFGSGRRRSSEEGVPLDAPTGRPDSQKQIS